MVEMSDESRRNLEQMDASARFPSGVGKIDRGECPIGAFTPMGCMFCEFGHMLECHHPYTCEEAECSHYREEVEAGGDGDIPDTWDDFQRDLQEEAP